MKCSRGSSSSSCNWVDRQVSLEPGGIPRVQRGPVPGRHLEICVNSCDRKRNFIVWSTKEIIIIIQVFAHALLQCKHQTSEHIESWSLFPFEDAWPLWILQTDFQLPCPFHYYYYLYKKSYKRITNDEQSL